VGFSLAYSAILIPQIEAPDSDLKIEKLYTPWLGEYFVTEEECYYSIFKRKVYVRFMNCETSE
jgi:hypothetical protein